MYRWDEYLSESKFLAGDEITIIDTIALPTFYCFDRSGFDFSAVGLKKIQEYVERNRTQASVQSTWPPHCELISEIILSIFSSK